MTGKQLIISLMIGAPIIIALAVYIGLLRDGMIPPPDLALIAERLRLGTVGAGQIALVFFIVVIGIMAALAPIIYAARSHDVVTVLISLAMTGTALALMITGRSVFDEIIALMIYLANMILASIAFAAHRISKRD